VQELPPELILESRVQLAVDVMKIGTTGASTEVEGWSRRRRRCRCWCRRCRRCRSDLSTAALPRSSK